MAFSFHNVILIATMCTEPSGKAVLAGHEKRKITAREIFQKMIQFYKNYPMCSGKERNLKPQSASS